MQAMYDLVGDKIREIFDAQVVDIGILDADGKTVHCPYTIERGVRFPDEPTVLGSSPLMREILREEARPRLERRRGLAGGARGRPRHPGRASALGHHRAADERA